MTLGMVLMLLGLGGEVDKHEDKDDNDEDGDEDAEAEAEAGRQCLATKAGVRARVWPRAGAPRLSAPGAQSLPIMTHACRSLSVITPLLPIRCSAFASRRAAGCVRVWDLKYFELIPPQIGRRAGRGCYFVLCKLTKHGNTQTPRVLCNARRVHTHAPGRAPRTPPSLPASLPRLEREHAGPRLVQRQ